MHGSAGRGRSNASDEPPRCAAGRDGGTAKQSPYDVYRDQCPTREVLSRLGDKWALLILGRLEGSPTRFNALRRDVNGISQKVLSQTLKRLERDGLISRTATPTVPVTVEYALTPLGETLTETVALLARWAENNMDAILSAQKDYDARQG